MTWDVNDESRVWDAATGECMAPGQLPGTMWVGPNLPEGCPYEFSNYGQPTVISDAATGELIAASNTGRWTESDGSDIYVFGMAAIGAHSAADPRRSVQRFNRWFPWR